MMTPDGSAVYDFGQNLAGVVEVELDAHAGDTIEIIHAEALDEHGNATTANYQPGDRHQEGGIQQKVTYICKEGHNHYQPFFTIMGFRYIKVNTAADLSSAVFTAHAIYSDMKETASFRCSNQDLNQLFKNSVWSMKSNFCYIPTDCPTRERAGWTGDAGVFISTGLRLMDSFPVFRKWLNDCRLNQHEDGRISNIAPQNGKPGMFTQLLSGSVGWGDACILVPYAMYEYTGDRSILSENYEMMQKWYGYLSDRAKKKPIKQIFRNDADEQYVIDTGIDYGEWCEPGVGTEAMGKPGQSVGTAFFAYSGRLLGRIAEILDHPEDAKQYREISEHARNAWYHRFTDHGMIHSDRQAEYVRALKFELLNETDAIAAAKTLNELVILNGYHLNTGFLSTPYLCEMLTKYGYIATAEKVLMQDTQPSWLYEVKKGATTVWERWDGIDTDGKVTGSLNHYSYGAISGWLLNSVCGIQYSFEQTVIHPLIELHLEYAEGSIDTPQGTVKCGWKKQSGKIHISCSIPSGMNAEIILPENLRKQVTAGQYEFDLSGK
jgi:alpha-L-rhamnosidase